MNSKMICLIFLIYQANCETHSFKMLPSNNMEIAENKVKKCVDDVNLIEKDIEELIEMAQKGKINPSELLLKLLELINTGEQVYTLCRTINQDDIIEYAKE